MIGHTFLSSWPVVTQIVLSGEVNLLQASVPAGHFFVLGSGLTALMNDGPLAFPQTMFWSTIGRFCPEIALIVSHHRSESRLQERLILRPLTK